MQLVLERSFPPGVEEETERVDARPSGKTSRSYAAAACRSFKIAAGLALVVAFGWAPLRAMLATTSVEAIINARIETIRSPLEGVVQFGPTAELEAAIAKTSQVTASRRRSEQLQKTGDISAAEGDRTQYEWRAATSAEAAARKRLEETRVERDAVADGVFVGDSYNDSPSSQQRATELRLRKGELEAQLDATRSQMNHLADQIAEEEGRYRERSEATANLPAKGRVWEMLIAPGEYVSKGQDLLRVLDCSKPIVSANVDERVYDHLEVGSPATFRPLEGAETYHGSVINLTGAAGASGNFAIPRCRYAKAPFT